MNTIDAIQTRRTIRQFKKDPISKDILEEILKAAMYAPSAYNEQPWQFIVIDDRKLLDSIPTFHPFADMCKNAPVAILVCADLKLEKSKDMWIFDCSAATQNILLAAHEKGIGSCWVSSYLREDRVQGFKKLLNLPDNIIPVALVPLGYPDQKISSVDRFKKDRIHYNSFSS